MSAAISRDLAELEATRIRGRVADLRDRARAAIRDLEGRLVEALGGDHLRGLKSLVPWGRFYAAMVHGSRVHGVDTYLAPGEWLVIDKDGRLAMATARPAPTGDPGVMVRPAGDDDLRVEDLAPYVAAVQVVLERHLRQARAAGLGYGRVEEVLDRLAKAFGYAW